MNLSELRPVPVITLDTEAFGPIRVTGLTVGGIGRVSKELENEHGSLDDFVTTFISGTTRKESGEALSLDEAKQLSEPERAQIVKAYVEKCQQEARFTSEDGETDAAILKRIIEKEVSEFSARLTKLSKEFADTTAPLREAAAKAQAALVPHQEGIQKILSGARFSELQDTWKKFNATIKPDLLSNDLLRSLKREASANSALMDSIRRVESTEKFSTIPKRIEIPTFPPPPILETNQRLNDINEQLEAMKDMAIEMAKTVSAVSETSSQFVRDFAAASADANRASKYAAWLAAIGILAAVGQIFYAAYSDHQKDPETKQAIATIATKIEALSGMIAEKGGLAHEDAEKLRAALGEISTNLRVVSPPAPTRAAKEKKASEP